MVFALDAVNAHKGDALVMRWGTDSAPRMMLIDGGPGATYRPHLLPHLRALAGHDHFGAQVQPWLDLVVVSHVDQDHILGIIQMAEDIDTALRTNTKPPVKVAGAWHNTYADLEFLPDFKDEPDLVKAIKEGGAQPNTLAAFDPAPAPGGHNPPPQEGLRAATQSVRQARALERLLMSAGISRNDDFADDFVRDGQAITLHGLTLTCILPNQDMLSKLRNTWKTELKKIITYDIKKAKEARMQALALALGDPSIPNQSSIVLHAEHDGKTMLLTGDARGDHLVTAIKNAPVDLTEVDLFKVPHHGSARSNSEELFALVPATHYVFSGNGDHGNPHALTLRALHKTQKGREFNVYLTNDPLVGAKKPEDVEKAKAAKKAIAELEADPLVAVVTRNPDEHAVSVTL